MGSECDWGRGGHHSWWHPGAVPQSSLEPCGIWDSPSVFSSLSSPSPLSWSHTGVGRWVLVTEEREVQEISASFGDFSFPFQIPALADAGFRVIALEMKGYGESTAPPGELSEL